MKAVELLPLPYRIFGPLAYYPTQWTSFATLLKRLAVKVRTAGEDDRAGLGSSTLYT